MTARAAREGFTAEEAAVGRARWTAWVDVNIGGRDAVRAAATEAAVGLALAGSSAEVSAAAARLAAGIPQERWLLLAEEAYVRGLLDEFWSLRPTGRLTAGGLADLRATYEARLATVSAALRPEPVPVSAPPGIAIPASEEPVVTRPAAQPRSVPVKPPAAPGPSLREFLSEHSILLLSYTGAFLLVVATVLFEIYGLTGLSGGLHFAGVLGLLVVFAAAGFTCLNSKRLRLVGHTYVAIAALMVPLAFIAAYLFLGLHERGITPEVGAVSTGLTCAITYGVLAVRLRASAYAYMSLAALPVAWVGAVQALSLGPWRGVALTSLIAAFALIAYAGDRLLPFGARFSSIAIPFVPAAALLAAGFAVHDFAVYHYSSPAVAYWAVTFAALGASSSYLLANALGSRRRDAVVGLLALLAAYVGAAHQLVPGPALGTAVAPAVVAFSTLHAFGRRAGAFGTRLATEAEGFIHIAAITTAYLLLIGFVRSQGWTPWLPEMASALLATAYLMRALAGRRSSAAAVALALLAFTWLAAAHDALPAAWQPVGAALLLSAIALTRLRAFEGTRLLDQWAELATPFGHAAAAATVVWILVAASQDPVGRLMSDLTSWPNTFAYLALALGYGILGVLGRGLLPALLARAFFAVAWLTAVQNLHLGSWRGPADVALTGLYLLLGYRGRHLGRVGELFRGSREMTVHASALVALALTLLDSVSVDDLVSWRATTTYAGLAAVYLLLARLGAGTFPATVGLAALGFAWGAFAHLVIGRPWEPLGLFPIAFLYTYLAHRGLGVRKLRDALAPPAEAGVHLVAAGVLAWTLVDAGSVDSLGWPALAALVGVSALYAAYSLLSGRRPALLVSVGAISFAVLGANHVAGLEDGGAAIELVVLAVAYALAHEFARDRILRRGLWIGMAGQALLPVLMADVPSSELAAVLLVSAAMFAAVSVRSRIPEWLLGAVAVVAAAWYWLAVAVLTPIAHPTADTLAAIYLPLPLLLGVLGITLRAAIGIRWAWPLYLGAGIGSLAVPMLAAQSNDFALCGGALLTYAVVIYTAAALDRRWEAFAAFVAFAAAGLIARLAGAEAAPAAFILALAALAIGSYAASMAWSRQLHRRSDWSDAHRYAGLGGSGLVALACFGIPHLTGPGNGGGLAALAALLGSAVLFYLDGATAGHPLQRYGAIFLASLGSFWIARQFGATNLQAYLAAPSLALLAIALRLPHDRRIRVDAGIVQVLVVVSALGLLGTTATQSLGEPTALYNYTGLLVVESVVGVIAGIGFRSRVVVVSGAAGVAIAALRALFVLVVSGLQLWIIFGSVAVLLLVLGAVLAVLRDWIPEARKALRDSWQQWS